jgi:hypothetical protein
MITLEMLGITPSAKPLQHTVKQATLEYECNQVVAFAGLNNILQRKPGSAFARLDIFQSKGVLVFIVTEPPDDIGMSITNYTDAAALMGLGHVFMGDEKGHPVNPQVIYIEHYPESVFAENFSIVTFTPSATGLTKRISLDRAQVERLIGQEFALGGEKEVSPQKVG